MRTEENGRIYKNRTYKKLRKQMYRMGVNRSYQGFDQALEAAFILGQDEELGNCMKVIFIDVAVKNHTSKENVERDIRYLIQIIWEQGDREALEEMAGRRLDKAPTCQEFIWMLAGYSKN